MAAGNPGFQQKRLDVQFTFRCCGRAVELTMTQRMLDWGPRRTSTYLFLCPWRQQIVREVELCAIEPPGASHPHLPVSTQRGRHVRLCVAAMEPLDAAKVADRLPKRAYF